MPFHLSQSITRLGRDRSNDIALPDDTRVSRYHVEIRRENGNYVLRDLNSRNGTQVNGRRATRHKLADGDRFRVGSGEFVFRDGALLLPSGAVVGGVSGAMGRSEANSAAVRPASGRNTGVLAAIGLLLVALIAVLAFVNLPRSTSLIPTATVPADPAARAETTARQWIRQNLELLTDEITDGAYPQIRRGAVEYSVLHDKVRERIADDIWETQIDQEVTEGVFRVVAKVTFGAGLVNPPDYSISTAYIITVDTHTGQVKQRVQDYLDVKRM